MNGLVIAFERAEAAETLMRHVIPEYSVEDVDRAGELLLDFPDLPDDWQDWSHEDEEQFQAWDNAFQVVNNWRASHSFPLNTS